MSYPSQCLNIIISKINLETLVEILIPEKEKNDKNAVSYINFMAFLLL